MTRFGRYEILEELGRGGTAVVYRARDTATEREVAVKVLSSHLLELGGDPTLRARFEREIKLAVRLEHPHIASILDVGTEGQHPYIVMRLLTGGSLQDRLRHGPLSLAETVRIVQEVASALDEAHRHHIVHRDLKPSNILFDQRGAAYLADFGVARLMDGDDSLTGTAGVVGTPAYMSPEQLKGQPVSGRADQYALGLVAFQALTARLPFEGTTAQMILQHLQEPLPSVRRYNAGLSLAFERVLARAAAKDPGARYATASEFAAALAAAAAEAPPQRLSALDPGPHTQPDMALATPMPPTRVSLMTGVLAQAREAAGAPATASPPARRNRWTYAAAAAAALVLIAMLALGWQWLSAAGANTPAPTLAPTVTLPAATTAAPSHTRDATALASGFVTLDPDAIGLAVVTLSPGLASAAVYGEPQGDIIATVPDRSIVQVLSGRAVTPDGVMWVQVKLLTGVIGWMVEDLLSYIRGATPAASASAVVPTTSPTVAGTLASGVIVTATPTRRPGLATSTTAPLPSNTSPVDNPPPNPTSQPPATSQPVDPTRPLPSATRPPATNTPLPSTGTAPPPTNTTEPPTPVPPTRTPEPPPPTPTNTPGVVCDLLPILCP